MQDVVTEPQPAPAPEPIKPEPAREPGQRHAAMNFEELFGRRLPIWAGGITLAIAGVLIVKYAIDAVSSPGCSLRASRRSAVRSSASA